MSRSRPSTIAEWFLHRRLGKFNGFAPEACPPRRLARTADYPLHRIDERLPWAKSRPAFGACNAYSKKMYLLPLSLSLSLIALSSGCALTPESMIRSQLDEAVAKAESMAVTDSGDRSDCKTSPKTWRAPIHSLTQDIRVQRCETVYYYFATYAQFVGDAYPIAFAPNIAFVGSEDLLTGEKRMAD